MKREQVLKALSELESKGKKRKFEQSIELIVAFRGLDVKKPNQNVDLKVELPFSTGKGESKALLFAKTQMFIDAVKGDFERVILEDDIPKLKKKDVMEILGFDILLAEGPVMIPVGKYLGQQLASKGKMPKPVLPDAELVRKELEQSKTSIRVTTRRGKGVPMIQVLVGKESMKPGEIAENVVKVYNEVEKALPKQKQNIKGAMVKKTMSPVVRL